MMARQFRKTYLAVGAPGAPDPRAGTIEAALVRQDIGREAYVRVSPADAPGAQAAFTRYRTLTADDAAALLELSPRTGRMHQLRVHLASIGRPIAGDPRYGGALALYGQPVPRLMLHAARCPAMSSALKAGPANAPIPSAGSPSPGSSRWGSAAS